MDAKELTNVGREIASADSANGTGSYAPDVGETAADARGDAKVREEEIEVTEEMIKAGASALEGFYLGDGTYDLTAPVLAIVYSAMNAAR
jgi:hypothetical protein